MGKAPSGSLPERVYASVGDRKFSIVVSSSAQRGWPTCVANTSVVDLDADLVSLGRSYLDIFNGKVLAGLPSDGGFASDGLCGKHW